MSTLFLRRLTTLRALLVQTDPLLLPSMDELLGQHVDLKKVRKIGEGEPILGWEGCWLAATNRTVQRVPVAGGCGACASLAA